MRRTGGLGVHECFHAGIGQILIRGLREHHHHDPFDLLELGRGGFVIGQCHQAIDDQLCIGQDVLGISRDQIFQQDLIVVDEYTREALGWRPSVFCWSPKMDP